MEISKKQLLSSSLKIGITEKQAQRLWEELAQEKTISSPFSKWIFYFGALIIISAMSWFMSLGWEWFGGGGIFLISSIYALFFTFLGAKLWKYEELKIPAGLLITIAVSMTPLAIYGLEKYFNIWPQEEPTMYRSYYELIKGSWVFMELGTILAGCLALRFFAFPFITAPIYVAAWFLTMDIIPLLLGKESEFEPRQWLSLFFGIVLIAIAYITDLKKKTDYAFWGYFFGAITFWGSLTSLYWDANEAVFATYLVINLLLMMFSIFLKRKIFMVLGAFGTLIYLGHLSYNLFKDSIFFPFVLSLIGLIIIFIGILYQKNQNRIEKVVSGLIPHSIRKYFPFE